MALLDRGKSYRVEERATFKSDWEHGVDEGWINPMVHPAVLATICGSILSTSPLSGQHIPGAPENVRAIGFPRSVQEPVNTEIRYSIIEDDRIVYLERIRRIL